MIRPNCPQCDKKMVAVTIRPKNKTETRINHRACVPCDEDFLIISEDNYNKIKEHANDVLGGWIKSIENEMTKVIIKSDFFDITILPKDMKNHKAWNNNKWKENIDENIVTESDLVSVIKKRISRLDIDRSIDSIAKVLFFEDEDGNTEWHNQEISALEDIYNYDDEELKAHCLE